MCIYIYTYMHVYTYINIYIYIWTYIYICTYNYVCGSACFCTNLILYTFFYVSRVDCVAVLLLACISFLCVGPCLRLCLCLCLRMYLLIGCVCCGCVSMCIQYRMAAVSRHWHATAIQHLAGLDALTHMDLDDAADFGGGRMLDVLRWCLNHVTFTALTRIDVGSGQRYGWVLPRQCLMALARSCASVKQLCLQGMVVNVDDSADSAEEAHHTDSANNQNIVCALKDLAALPALECVDLTFCRQVHCRVLSRLQELLPRVRIQRLPEWYLRGGGEHECVAHPGIPQGENSWFRIGERHTYTPEGRFVFEPREQLASGLVNRAWPMTKGSGFIMELQFDSEVPQYCPQVRIERCSHDYIAAHELTSAALHGPGYDCAGTLDSHRDACHGSNVFFTSAHSTRSLSVPEYTPGLSTPDVTVGIWRIQDAGAV